MFAKVLAQESGLESCVDGVENEQDLERDRAKSAAGAAADAAARASLRGSQGEDGDDALVSRLRVLSYSPGPMLTGMHGKDTEMNGDAQHMRSARASPELQCWSRDLGDSGAFVDPDASAEKCVALLRSGTFENGTQVDWYDDV